MEATSASEPEANARTTLSLSTLRPGTAIGWVASRNGERLATNRSASADVIGALLMTMVDRSPKSVNVAARRRCGIRQPGSSNPPSTKGVKETEPLIAR